MVLPILSEDVIIYILNFVKSTVAINKKTRNIFKVRPHISWGRTSAESRVLEYLFYRESGDPLEILSSPNYYNYNSFLDHAYNFRYCINKISNHNVEDQNNPDKSWKNISLFWINDFNQWSDDNNDSNSEYSFSEESLYNLDIWF